MKRFFYIGQRTTTGALLLLILSAAIAPLFLIGGETQAQESDTTLRACRDETLLLPKHPDVRSLDQLYQAYLGYSLPNLDLGLSRLEFAQQLVQFSAQIELGRNEQKSLSDSDQARVQDLTGKYRGAIATLKEQEKKAGRDRRIHGRKSSFSGAVSRQQTLTSPSATPSPTSPSATPSPAPALSQSRLGSSGPLSESVSSNAGRFRPPVPIGDSSLLELPPGFNTEEYARIKDNPFFVPSQVPLSTFSVDVDTASYSNVRRFLKQGQLPPKDAVRIEEMINYFSYDYAEPQGDQPFSINTEVGQAPWNPEHLLVQIGLKGRELETRQPSNLVFLVDASGSMRSPNKLPLLQRSLCMLVREMKSTDRVTLVTYSGNAGLVLPPTPGSEKRKILDAIANLEAGGSTAGSAGINLAYDMTQKHLLPNGNNRVILATDGDFNVGVSSNAELERLIEQKRKGGVYLSVLGFGTGNYKDSKMEILANKGNGNYAYIDTLAEARKVLVEDLTSTLFTIAKDVKIQVEFNPAHVQAYRLIGYENRILRDQDFNDDRKDAGEIGAGHTVTALYEVIPVGVNADIPLPQIDELKYQKPLATSPGANPEELMQVKLRYKRPNQSSSVLLTQTIANRAIDASVTSNNVSNNLQFASAVAMFGMVLRDSEFKGGSDFEQVNQMLQTIDDLDSSQSEFQSLVSRARSIQ